MGDVLVAAQTGHFENTEVGFLQQIPSMVEAQGADILPRRLPQRLLEAAIEGANTHAELPGEQGQGYLAGKIIIQPNLYLENTFIGMVLHMFGKIAAGLKGAAN